MSIDINPWKIKDRNSEDTENLIRGIPIGTAIINNKLVVFTTSKSGDSIYVLEYSDEDKTLLKGLRMYFGYLGFDVNYPIETLVSFEANHIQKVYWTDGKNQPRLINIADKDHLKRWYHVYKDNEDSEETSHFNIDIDTFFDFVPSIKGGNIGIEQRNSGEGLFAPGVIQYCFSYFNKYGQQSNIIDVSPLYYLSYDNRGASPEDKVSSSFLITISNIDLSFDYIRLYSIQRTSLNLEPIVKVVKDIQITDTMHSTTKTLYNVPLSIVYITGEYSNKTLPRENAPSNNKILKATVDEGENFSVSITSKPKTVGHANSKEFKFSTFSSTTDTEGRDIISLQDVIDEILNGNFYPNCEQDCELRDYYTIFNLSQDFDTEMQERASHVDDRSSITWDLVVNGVRQFVDPRTDYLVYSFGDENWYIVNSKDNITVQTSKEITVEMETLTYLDRGITGYSLDPTELLFVGGKEISSLTMIDKDCTLFLGNCAQKHASINALQEYFDNIRNGNVSSENNKPIFYRDGNRKTIYQDAVNGLYSNTFTLKWNNREITSFKGGDTYRLGFQLQKNNGEWLDPVFMDDVRNIYYPKTLYDNSTQRQYIQLPYAKANIDLSEIDTDITTYKSIRPVVIYPTIADREVLCQGVLNPTLFNSLDRIDKQPFAQASWYFRPYTGKLEGSSASPEYSGVEGVYSEELTSDPDLTIEPSYFVGKTTLVYVMIVRVSLQNDYYLDFIKNGVLNITVHSYEKDINGYIQEDNWKAEENYFWGSIILEKDQLNATIALIGNFKFNKQVDSNPQTAADTSVTDYSYVYDNCAYIATSGSARFPIYDGMKFNNSTLLYYINPTDDSQLDSYVFKFYARDNYYTNQDTYYKITFGSDEETSPIIINSLSGSTLRFTHYSHICSRTDANGDYQMIEIQNAENMYDSPFSEYDKKKNTTNAEFFIDQSIVTLNSPDIEFDTDVQNYTKEDLKLRIVGAIPITASASAHSINASTPMLEVNHNVESDKMDVFGVGELNNNVYHENSRDTNRFGSKRLVADYLWNDSIVAHLNNDDDSEEEIKTLNFTKDYLIHPWHRTGSLNNDWRKKSDASSWLSTKKESNLLYSLFTDYLQPSSNSDNSNIKKYTSIGFDIHLWNNEQVLNYRFPKQSNHSSEINYYPNIDKALYNTVPYQIYPFTTGEASKVTSPVSMKYKSSSHAIITLNATSTPNIPILPYADRGNGTYIGKYTNDVTGTTFWKDTNMFFDQDFIRSSDLPAINYDFLWIGEVYKDVQDAFKGRNDGWQIAGEAVSLENGNATIYWTEGDTYYQRYDCLKTYPYTNDDTNQLVEILSFMCETHVNIDGRYDRNRGQIDNTNMRPQIFNLLNPVYSQQDNFFTYNKVGIDKNDELIYPNQIIYSKTKVSGADIDLWTNVTLASALELDGDKGEIKKLTKLNDQILAFQDTGIAQVLYNDNVAIATQQGVPIEIANSGKVQGKRYISDTIGCSNKWALTNAPSGIYFIDSIGKNIFLFNGQLDNLSTKGGLNTWCKSNIPSSRMSWTPESFNNFVSYYDKMNQEVLFINRNEALAFSEKSASFTSFYDYGNTSYFCNLDDTGIWVKDSSTVSRQGPPRLISKSTLWKHHAGKYCNFFDNDYPYSMTLVANADPQIDKIFSNLDFRACVDEDNTETVGNITTFKSFKTPFDTLETWNEYQHGIANLSIKNGHDAMVHHTPDNEGSIKRKFRMWRCDVPRDNAELSTDSELPTLVSRFKKHPLNRMRNPWIYMKLQKNPGDGGLPRTEIHDILMSYYL